MAVLTWLDRYIEVDRLHVRPVEVFPRMTWWQWPWYVAAVAAAAIATPTFDAWQNGLLDSVPYLRHLPQLVTWPVLGVVYGLGSRYLMPGCAARAAAPGEAWLIGGIWLAVAALGFCVGVDLL